MDMIVGLCAEFVSNSGETLDFIYEESLEFTDRDKSSGFPLIYAEQTAESFASCQNLSRDPVKQTHTD